MARRKPAQEKQAVLVRLPENEVAELIQLAAKSTHADGSKMSLNQYCLAVLADALARGLVVRETINYEVAPTALVGEAEDAAPYTAGRKKKDAGS